jgi:hypothetical protein
MSKKINVIESVTPAAEAPHVTKSARDAAKEKLQELIKEETRLVRGIFQSFETPGATVPIFIKKYPGIPPFKMSMTDGYTYEIPLYVARFINGIDVSAGALSDDKDPRHQMIGTCSYPVHGFKVAMGGDLAQSSLGSGPQGEGGIPVPIVGVASRKKRYGFQSLEFGGAA